MDSTLIIWVFCIIGAVIGIKKSLSSTIIFTWSIGFSLYLSVWSYAYVNSFLSSFPEKLVLWKPVLIIAIIVAVVLGVLSAAKKGILKDRELDVDFPVIVNYVGGLFFGGSAGALLAMLLLLVFGLSPYSSAISREFEENNAKVTSSSIVSFTNIVNGFSFQKHVDEHQKKFLDDLLEPKAILEDAEEDGDNKNDKKEDLLEDKSKLPVK